MQFKERNGNVSLFLDHLKLIDEVSSVNYDKIQLFKHPSLGKVLILDGELQFIEAWTPIYHETLVHLCCAFIEKVERVLILGGGCFFAAREALKYSTVKEVVMIDYDDQVINLIEGNFNHVQGIIEDKRFKLYINDAFKEVKVLNRKFDVIINDAVDLTRYANTKVNLFSYLESYTNHNGICSDLVYRHIFEKETLKLTLKNLQKIKSNPVFSLVTVPEYPGVLHLLTIWGRSKMLQQNRTKPINLIQKSWIRHPQTKPCEFYDPRYLNYYLYLPPYLKKIIDEGSNF